MSHNGNTELLLCLFEEEIETVQKRFPKLTDAQTEHVAAKRATKRFWERAQWSTTHLVKYQ